MTVKEHYDKHLARFYAWMAGDFDQQVLQHQKLFETLKIKPIATKTALDLGSGHGIQSIALRNLGYQVTAVDFNAQLLAALRNNDVSQTIVTAEADILEFMNVHTTPLELIVCMGDTLTHLQNHQAVTQLIHLISKKMIKGGNVVFGFRELVTELKNEARFIPVKSDDNRILTCFLEYHRDHVMVHDILHEKENGTWKQTVSAYPKLRLSKEQVIDTLQASAMKVVHVEAGPRFTLIAAEKV